MQLGPFVLDTLLGRGSFGEVYRGIHVKSGEHVAVKLLPGEKASRWRALLRREVEAVARLDHAGIVWIHDHGEDDDAGPWVAYELASGGTLAERGALADFGALRGLLDELLGALAHAHARSVLHRDLKPANVLLCTIDDPRPGPKLADFSIAAVGAERGIAGGTPDYLAPEQRDRRFEDEGPWTDLYALGGLAWASSCGAPPTKSSWRPRFSVPGEFVAWVDRLLMERPEDRFPSAAAARRALRDVGAVEGPPTPLRGSRTFDDPVERPLKPHPRRSAASLGLFGLRPVPVCGRSLEIGAALRALAEVEAGRGPAAVRFVGEAGSGKTHLLRHLEVSLREEDRAVVVAAPGRPGSVADVIRAGLKRAHVERRLAPDDRTASFLGGADGDPLGMLAAFTRAHGPVVWLVDDARRGTQLEQALAGAVRSDAPGLLVVAATRDANPLPGVVDVPLLRLREPSQVARAMGVTNARLAYAVGQRSGGLPSLVVAVVRDLVRSGRLTPGPDGWVAVGAIDVELPEDVAREVDRRVPVSDDDRAAIEILALCGAVGTERMWRAACESAGVPWRPELPDQARRGGLVQAGPDPWDHHLLANAADVDRVCLADHLVSDTLIQDLEGRGDLGRLAGIVADQVQAHAHPSVDRDIHLGELWRLAGRYTAAANQLFAAAVAVPIIDDTDRRHALLDAVEDCLARAPDAELAAKVVLWRAAAWTIAGEVERAFAAVEALEDGGSAFTAWRRRLMAAQLLDHQGRWHAALAEIDRSLAFAPTHDERRFTLVQRGGILLALGRVDEADATYSGMAADYLSATLALGTVRLQQGRLDEAEALLMGPFRASAMGVWWRNVMWLRFLRGEPTRDLLWAHVDELGATRADHRAVTLALLAWVCAVERPEELAVVEARCRDATVSSRLRDHLARHYLQEAAALASHELAVRLRDLAAWHEPQDGEGDAAR